MTSSPPPSFGDVLRRLREAAGLTQEQLAEAAGLTAKAISALERGERRRPHPSTVTALAAALGGDARAALIAAVPRRGDAGGVAPPPERVHTLPVPLTPLIGRETEVAALTGYLQGGVRLLTLTGPGGIGKSRLALQVASELGTSYPDGVVVVLLAPLQEPGLVLATIAHALGLREAGGIVLADALQAEVRGRRMLLVLDNFEHVLDAAPDVAMLLAAGPGLQVMTTSRASLRLRGEQQFPVPPLALPDMEALPVLHDVAGVPTVRLFVERAQEVQPAFALTPANAAAIAAICRRLDGLPLAIELAAARSKLLPPTALLARLDRVLPLLIDGPRDLPARQQTLRSTIAWSYDLLGPDEQALFRRCAVFAGGWDHAAACAVAPAAVSEDDVLGILASLHDKSLLLADEASTGEARFGMLETIRAFAHEQLAASGEEDTARRDHAAFFRDLAGEAGPRLKSPDQPQWLDRLQREHDNMRVAISWLLARGDVASAVEIGYGMWLFWAMSGHLGEAMRWTEQVLAGSGALDRRDRARALLLYAALLHPQNAFDRAAGPLAEATTEARALGDDELLMTTLILYGLFAAGHGEIAGAEAAQMEALALARARDDVWGMANTLNGLAHVAMARGSFEGALGHLHEAEALLRASGDPFTLSVNLNIQALIAQLGGDEGTLRRLLVESAGISARLGDTWAALYSLAGLAIADSMGGRPRRAALLFGAVESLRGATTVAFGFAASREMYDQHVAAVRAALDPEMFHAAWAAGQAMTLHEAIAAATDEDPDPGAG